MRPIYIGELIAKINRMLKGPAGLKNPEVTPRRLRFSSEWIVLSAANETSSNKTAWLVPDLHEPRDNGYLYKSHYECSRNGYEVFVVDRFPHQDPAAWKAASICFIEADVAIGGPPRRGYCVFYYGHRKHLFSKHFSAIGRIVMEEGYKENNDIPTQSEMDPDIAELKERIEEERRRSVIQVILTDERFSHLSMSGILEVLGDDKEIKETLMSTPLSAIVSVMTNGGEDGGEDDDNDENDNDGGGDESGMDVRMGNDELAPWNGYRISENEELVLNCLEQWEDQGLGRAEIERGTDLSQSQVRRALETLQARQFVFTIGVPRSKDMKYVHYKFNEDDDQEADDAQEEEA